MARIIFYEKPGCGGNAKQKAWLESAGHRLEVRDLSRGPWTAETLKDWLAHLPVSDWFNRAARRIKSGELVPEQMDAGTALALLLEEPLLIRRPLLQLEDGTRLVGFDAGLLETLLGPVGSAKRPREGCNAPNNPCPEPKASAIPQP